MKARPTSAIIETLIEQGHVEILDEVCFFHRLDREAVCSRRRTRAIALARHELFWRLRDLALTYDQIGAIFGRQHSTIVRGIIAFKRSWRGLALVPPASSPPPVPTPLVTIAPTQRTAHFRETLALGA
jgi:hypothetical protein